MLLITAAQMQELDQRTIKEFSSKASELAGVSRQGFLESLNRFMVSPFQVTPEELAQELTDA